MIASLTRNAALPTGCEKQRQGNDGPRAAGASAGALPRSNCSPVHACARGTNSIAPFSRIDRDDEGRVVRVVPVMPVPFGRRGW